MQISASVGGECAVQSLLEKIDEAPVTGLSPAIATTEGKVATEPDLASGWVGALFLGDVAQQVWLPQQLDWHALSLDVLERMHCRAERLAGDAANATKTNIEIIMRLSIDFSYSTS